jgi:WD40 repeat protein
MELHSFVHPAVTLLMRKTAASVGAQCLSLAFSPTDQFFGAGFGDGTTRLWDLESLQRITTLNRSNSLEPDDPGYGKDIYSEPYAPVKLSLQGDNPSAVASIKFRPGTLREDLLLGVDAVGTVYLWANEPGKHDLKTVRAIPGSNEEDVNLGHYSCDWSLDGSFFAVAGVNRSISVFDANGISVSNLHTFPLKSQFSMEPIVTDEGHVQGHTNRISAIRCSPTDINLILSASWDNTIILWDKRFKKPVSTLRHFNLGGNAIQFSPDGRSVVACTQTTVQEFGLDLISRSKTTINDPKCKILSCAFDSNSRLFLAGGDLTGYAGEFVLKTQEMRTFEFSDTCGPFWTTQTANRASVMALGSSDGLVKLIQY